MYVEESAFIIAAPYSAVGGGSNIGSMPIDGFYPYPPLEVPDAGLLSQVPRSPRHQRSATGNFEKRQASYTGEVFSLRGHRFQDR